MFCANASNWHMEPKSASCTFPIQISANDCVAGFPGGLFGADTWHAEAFAKDWRYREQLWLVLAADKLIKTNAISNFV